MRPHAQVTIKHHLYPASFLNTAGSLCFYLPSGCFSKLRVLALNGCGIKSWAAVQLLEPHLPVIEELYLSSNALPDLPRLKAEQAYQDATGAAPSAVVAGKHLFSHLTIAKYMFAKVPVPTMYVYQQTQ